MKSLWLFLLVAACGPKHQQIEPKPKLDELKEKYEFALRIAASNRDLENGWLISTDGDAMLWNGKLASSTGVHEIAITAAECPNEPGRFTRHPYRGCPTSDEGDETSWSRDMGTGLITYGYLKNDLNLLERHGNYGKAHNWVMGHPIHDGRVIYTPNMIGLLYKAIFALGGEYDSNVLWPSYFPAGLDDYEANLQVMSIYLQGEIAKALNEADAVPRPKKENLEILSSPEDGEFLVDSQGDLRLLEISETMFERLKEHATAQPKCPLFLAVHGLYTGDQSSALDNLLFDFKPQCSYLHCGDSTPGCEAIRIIDWIFAADIILRAQAKG